MGRDSTYTPELAAEILERFEAGESLRSICRDPHMPSEMSVRRWATDDVDGFRARYAEARNGYLDHMAEEILEIADTTEEGEIVKSGIDGTEITTRDMIDHRRLRVDSRKWYLAKLAPKRYGDRVAHEHTGADGGPIKTESNIDPEHREQLLAAIAAQIAELAQGKSAVDSASRPAADDVPV